MHRRQPGNSGPVRGAGRGSAARGRSGSRPAAARRAAAGGSAKRTTAPSQNRRLTGQATTLLVVLAALALAYAYPVRIYLTQLADMDAMRLSQQEQRDRIGRLEEQVVKWQDDEYVEAQARSRLYYVHPGETPLVPIFAPDKSERGAGQVGEPRDEHGRPWYGTLWSSLTEANSEPEADSDPEADSRPEADSEPDTDREPDRTKR